MRRVPVPWYGDGRLITPAATQRPAGGERPSAAWGPGAQGGSRPQEGWRGKGGGAHHAAPHGAQFNARASGASGTFHFVFSDAQLTEGD